MGPLDLITKYLTVAELIIADTGKWNMRKIMNLLPQEAQNILCIRPSKLGAKDSYIWLSTKDGEKYSTKTGYQIVLA